MAGTWAPMVKGRNSRALPLLALNCREQIEVEIAHQDWTAAELNAVDWEFIDEPEKPSPEVYEMDWESLKIHVQPDWWVKSKLPSRPEELPEPDIIVEGEQK